MNPMTSKRRKRRFLILMGVKATGHILPPPSHHSSRRHRLESDKRAPDRWLHQRLASLCVIVQIPGVGP